MKADMISEGFCYDGEKPSYQYAIVFSALLFPLPAKRDTWRGTTHTCGRQFDLGANNDQEDGPKMIIMIYINSNFDSLSLYTVSHSSSSEHLSFSARFFTSSFMESLA